MKEQIRDLEKQSGIDVYSLGLDRAKWESKLEKFAELIVKECAGLVLGVPVDTMGYHTADQKIKEHFGIQNEQEPGKI